MGSIQDVGLMIEQILIGRGNSIREMPRLEWERELRQTPERAEDRLAFMSEDHHRVRRMAVTDLARRGQPLEPEYFARQLNLDPVRVVEILGELERKLFFLVRNAEGAVSWAYPVTVDRTPHKLTFSTGERLHGA
jgi:hypothetical protein